MTNGDVTAYVERVRPALHDIYRIVGGKLLYQVHLTDIWRVLSNCACVGSYPQRKSIAWRLTWGMPNPDTAVM